MTDKPVVRKPVPAVAAVVLQDGKLLLIRRGVEPSAGRWAVPGGSIEWGEPLTDALKREVREETGLEVEIDGVAGVFDLIVEARPRSTETKPQLTFHYVIIDYFAHPIGGSLVPGDDAADVRWAPLDELDSYDLTQHLRDRLVEMGVLAS